MKALRRIWRRLAGSVTGHRREDELAAEFEAHIEMAIDDNLRRGMPPAEARRAALVEFGGVEASKESYRDQRGLPWIADLRRDFQYACRGMRRSPGFSAAVIACLALGIGANTAVFSVLNAVMLRSLPVREPEQLVLFRYESKNYPRAVLRRTSGMGKTSLPYYAFEPLRRRTQTLAGLIAFVPIGLSGDTLTVAADGRPTVAGGEMVSGNFFTVLGVPPMLGRLIVEDDLRADAPHVAVLSHRYWSREFGREPEAIGRMIALNGQRFTIVGVTPPEFFGVDPGFAPDIWVPLKEMAGVTPWGVGASSFRDRLWWWCMMMGRLKPGMTQQQAQAELDTLFRQSVTEGLSQMPGPEEMPRLVLDPAGHGLENLRRMFSKPLRVLIGAVLLVLLIACVNVATLLLARTNARRREMNVRLAIGASRARLVRQLLTESVLLAACGGIAGGVIAIWGSGALLRAMSGQIPAHGLDVRPDAAVLAFTAAVSLLTGILFGLAPALRGAFGAAGARLNDAAARTTPRQRLTKTLIAAQVALSTVLLFGAGLFVRTLQNLTSQDLGFHRENLLLFQIDARRVGYEPGRVLATYGRALEQIRNLPGVPSATLSRFAPLSGWANNTPMALDIGDPPVAADGHPDGVDWNVVGPDYFETMGIPLLLGHGIGRDDVAGGRRVAVISETLARERLAGGSVLGHRISFGRRYDPEDSFEIVGVARNTKWTRMREERPKAAYIPYSTETKRVGPMFVIARTPGDPMRMVPAVRDAMSRVDANLPLFSIKTQRGQIEEALTQERMLARFSSLLGALALLLVSVGLYGTLGYAVARRTGEIGVRVALGAGRRRVVWMILREGLVVVACGLAVGLPTALALGRVVGSLLFDVKSHDAVTAVATMAALTVIGIAAGTLPAWRASRIEPVEALRHE